LFFRGGCHPTGFEKLTFHAAAQAMETKVSTFSPFSLDSLLLFTLAEEWLQGLGLGWPAELSRIGPLSAPHDAR